MKSTHSAVQQTRSDGSLTSRKAEITHHGDFLYNRYSICVKLINFNITFSFMPAEKFLIIALCIHARDYGTEIHRDILRGGGNEKFFQSRTGVGPYPADHQRTYQSA